MKKGLILIVEDEEALLSTLKLNLELENYEIMTAASGQEARSKFKDNNKIINLILLDVMLPEISGFDLCAEFKNIQPNIPIIFITAKSLSADKITGLKLGAEDYITKPFELEELLLRINNVMKRHPVKNENKYTFGNCEINFDNYEITDVNSKKHTLSKREIGLLKLLTEAEGKVISRDEIIDTLWEEDENASSRTIDNYILNFRKHFENNPKEPRYFHSIRGVGYKFTSD